MIVSPGVREAVPSAGLLVLRVFIGLCLAAHGAQKFFQVGLSGFSGHLVSLGFPAPGLMAFLSAATEFGGGFLVAVGLLTRPAALALTINMLVAALVVHAKEGYFLPKGMEYALNLAAAFAAIVLTGPGRFSLDAVLARRRDS
ncbi:MAG TPA: DoxX family protein [Planctomycetota bacterium]|nr:DoxX family protein [Planctomycetota bacterium]